MGSGLDLRTIQRVSLINPTGESYPDYVESDFALRLLDHDGSYAAMQVYGTVPMPPDTKQLHPLSAMPASTTPHLTMLFMTALPKPLMLLPNSRLNVTLTRVLSSKAIGNSGSTWVRYSRVIWHLPMFPMAASYSHHGAPISSHDQYTTRCGLHCIRLSTHGGLGQSMKSFGFLLSYAVANAPIGSQTWSAQGTKVLYFGKQPP